MHASRTALRASCDGSIEWARAVVRYDAAHQAAEALIPCEPPCEALRCSTPWWRAGKSAAFEALAARVTEVLPKAGGAWALRGDACMRLPMGSSIAAEFYEKAESLARDAGAVEVADAYAVKKEAATAKFLANLGMASESLANKMGAAHAS